MAKKPVTEQGTKSVPSPRLVPKTLDPPGSSIPHAHVREQACGTMFFIGYQETVSFLGEYLIVFNVQKLVSFF